MVELKKVTEEEKDLLRNLLQKYLYELSAFYGDEIDAEGNFTYRYFENYFCESERKALFIIEDGGIIGFALLNKNSYIGGNPDNVIAEFCILPKFRKAGKAEAAFRLLCETYPGSWELKFSEKNIPATRLWNRVTKAFAPERYKDGDGETVLAFRTEKNRFGG